MPKKWKKIEPEIIGKTFNDFIFRPQLGIVGHREEVELKTKFSKNITLNFPVVSANMDTVTESSMAIAIAQFGGLGIIHRNFSIERQVEEVKKVKRAKNFIIDSPYTLKETDAIASARQLMKDKKVGTVVVVDEKYRLRGILTLRDLRFFPDDDEHNLMTVDSLMTPISRLQFEKKLVTLEEAKNFLQEHRIKKMPLVDNRDLTLIGLVTSKDVEELINHPLANKDAKGRLRLGAAIGVVGDFLERACELIEAGVDVLVMDIAHGHSLNMKRGIEEFRKKFNDFELVCGNIATHEGASFLKELGVDGVKVGVGPGKGCRTRLETGVGVAQLQAIREVYRVLEDEIPFIADGGVENDKDIWEAIAFGASSVMLGSILSGTDESPGDIIPDPQTGLKNKKYRGMTSPEAKIKIESPEDRRSPDFIEGQEMKVPYKGSVHDILKRIKEHLQSSVSQAGARSLQEARTKMAPMILCYVDIISEAAKKESFER